MNTPQPQVALLPRLDERFWLMRNFALELVRHLGVTEPPVLMDGLLTNPPVGLNNRVHATGAGTLRLSLAGIGPADFAPDAGKLGDADLKEVRYQFSRWILPQIAHGELGSAMGLPAFIDPQLADCQDYFARVLLAPDFMVAEYRRQGNRFDLFADRFLIPDRVAFQRWMDPAFPNQFD